MTNRACLELQGDDGHTGQVTEVRSPRRIKIQNSPISNRMNVRCSLTLSLLQKSFCRSMLFARRTSRFVTDCQDWCGRMRSLSLFYRAHSLQFLFPFNFLPAIFTQKQPKKQPKINLHLQRRYGRRQRCRPGIFVQI